MTELLLYKIVLIAAALVSFAAAYLLLKFKAPALPLCEKLLRNRNLGIPLALAGLLWCVPYSRPLVWDWMAPWLLPLVVVLTVLVYFYLEYLPSRAVAGIMILYTAYVAQESYAFHTPGAGWLMILSWMMAVVGMFIAAKPYLIRDYFRKIVVDERYRLIGVAFFTVYGLWSLTVGVIHIVKGQIV